MRMIENFINLNIQKLFLKGDIARVYSKMYSIAEEIAIHEVKQKQHSLINKADRRFKKTKDIFSFPDEVSKYKEKRIQHHINEMKELLKMREELKENKKTENDL